MHIYIYIHMYINSTKKFYDSSEYHAEMLCVIKKSNGTERLINLFFIRSLYYLCIQSISRLNTRLVCGKEISIPPR